MLITATYKIKNKLRRELFIYVLTAFNFMHVFARVGLVKAFKTAKNAYKVYTICIVCV